MFNRSLPLLAFVLLLPTAVAEENSSDEDPLDGIVDTDGACLETGPGMVIDPYVSVASGDLTVAVPFPHKGGVGHVRAGYQDGAEGECSILPEPDQ